MMDGGVKVSEVEGLKGKGKVEARGLWSGIEIEKCETNWTFQKGKWRLELLELLGEGNGKSIAEAGREEAVPIHFCCTTIFVKFIGSRLKECVEYFYWPSASV